MAGSKFLLTMKLTTQGDVKGSSKKKEGPLDYSTGMECHGFEYEAQTQIDPPSGQPVGKRGHRPITIRTGGPASPKLLLALYSNEVFENATLTFNRIDPDGKAAMAHTIELKNGTIVAIKHVTGSGGRYVDVTLAYDDLLVNGLPNAIIPYSTLGFVTR